MEYMFQKCSSLVKVNLSFDTSKVTLMNGMFSDCYSLTSVDLSNFNTTNVIDINCLFLECHSLTSIDLTNVNFVNTKTYFGMFSGISDNGNIIYNKNLIREEIIALIPQSWNKTENEEEI
jgi:surface protein